MRIWAHAELEPSSKSPQPFIDTEETSLVSIFSTTDIVATIPSAAWLPMEQSYVNVPGVLNVTQPKSPPEFGGRYWSTRSWGFP